MYISIKKGVFKTYLISRLKRLIIPTFFKGLGACLFSLVREGIVWFSLCLQGHVIIFKFYNKYKKYLTPESKLRLITGDDFFKDKERKITYIENYVKD